MFACALRCALLAFALPCAAGSNSSKPSLLVVREVPQTLGLFEPEVDMFDEPGALLVVPLRDSLSSSGSTDETTAGSVVSEESVTQNDGSGHAVTKTRVCKNGKCEERTERTEASKQAASLQTATELSDAPLMRNAFGAPCEKHLRGAMQELEKGFEDDGFFNKDFGGDSKRSMEDGGFFKAFGSDSAHSADHAGSEDSVFQDQQGNMKAASRSVSTETIMKNGHRVQRTTECVDGRCTTKVMGEAPQEESKDEEIPKAVVDEAPEKKNILPF